MNSPVVSSNPVVDDVGQQSHPLDPVCLALAQWLAKHVTDPELARWVVQRGARLHPEFADLIDHEVGNAQAIPDALKKVWRVLTSPALILSGPEPGRYQATRGRVAADTWSAALRVELLSALSPCLAIGPQRFPRPDAGADPVTVDQIMSLDCELRCGDARDDVAAAFRSRTDHRARAIELSFSLTCLLRDAMDLQAALDEARPDYDRSSSEHPSIEPHAQNTFHHGWTLLIDLLRESFDLARVDAPDLALALVRVWTGVEYPVFRRLILYAAAKGIMP
jgi:hypothetical protein